jgi:hypothetical protein
MAFWAHYWTAIQPFHAAHSRPHTITKAFYLGLFSVLLANLGRGGLDWLCHATGNSAKESFRQLNKIGMIHTSAGKNDAVSNKHSFVKLAQGG